MCSHVPRCPESDAADRSAARVVAAHPEQGWNLLCNGVILFEDSGQLVPEGEALVPRTPPRPRWGRRRSARRERRGPEHAIVLAGGGGPRPAGEPPTALAELGEHPLLEITLRRLRATGVRRVTLCVSALGDRIRAEIGEGDRLGLEVDYTQEDRPLGTAGSLRLVPDWSGPALVVNGDVLSAVDFADLFRRHERSRAVLTVAYQRRHVPTSVGMLRLQGDRVRGISEKPRLTWNVVSGIYVADPSVCALIPPETPVDMPDVVTALLGRGRRVRGYGFAGPWHDIGTPERHRRAAEEFTADPRRYLEPPQTDVPQEERWAS